jgi:hypothetical protein
MPFGLRRTAATVGVAALAGYLLISNAGYLDRRWAAAAESRSYWETVQRNAAQWSDPGVSLVPLVGHPGMATSWAVDLARHEPLLSLVEKGFLPRYGGPPVLIDAEGTVRPAALERMQPTPDLVRGRCEGPTPRFVDTVDLDAQARIAAQQLFLRLDYRADQEVDVELTARWGQQSHTNTVPTTLRPGHHTRLIPVDAGGLERLRLRVVGPSGAGLCVERYDVVRALVVEDDGRRCREVDWYGRPEAVVPCPPG